jgi:alanyl-tRNA synthetase
MKQVSIVLLILQLNLKTILSCRNVSEQPQVPTEKLYYSDPYLTETIGTVLAKRSEGKKTWYALDKTIFYPGGGGQQPDSGRINSFEVYQIIEEQGVIWHQVDGQIKGQVVLKIDWPLRLKRMQQHAGQHLASAVFFREYGISTVSVHLGQDDTLIEFDTPDIAPEILKEAEKKINELIRADLLFKAFWVDKKRLSEFNLRRDVKIAGDRIRLVQIADYDITGCGGTHVDSTAQIGLVKIIGNEKIRKHSRIQFRIGESAYQLLNQAIDVVQNLSNKLSSGIDELEGKISKLLDEQSELRRRLNQFRSHWLETRVDELRIDSAVGFFSLADVSRADLIDLSALWIEKNEKPCFFLGTEDDKHIFVIRTLDQTDPSAVQIIKTCAPEFNLRGGGSDEFAQGIIIDSPITSDYLDRLNEVFQTNFKKEE